MVYLFGILGFVVGFGAGLMFIHFLLRNKSRRELLEDDSLKWKFGMLTWGMAALTSYAFVQMYNEYQQLSM